MWKPDQNILTSDDAAKYTATYQNLETTACLTVAIAPQIISENLKDRIVMKVGTSAAVEIPFSGSPQPEASWKFKGGKLPDMRRFKVETIRNMTALTISKAVRKDTGKYTLSLNNKHGKVTFDLELVVLGKIFDNYFVSQVIESKFGRKQNFQYRCIFFCICLHTQPTNAPLINFSGYAFYFFFS